MLEQLVGWRYIFTVNYLNVQFWFLYPAWETSIPLPNISVIVVDHIVQGLNSYLKMCQKTLSPGLLKELVAHPGTYFWSKWLFSGPWVERCVRCSLATSRYRWR